MKLQSVFQTHFYVQVCLLMCLNQWYTSAIFCSVMYFLNELSTIHFNIFIIFVYYLLFPFHLFEIWLSEVNTTSMWKLW